MRFLIGGDLVLDEEVLEGSNNREVLAEVLKYKEDNGVDLLVANLEAPITKSNNATKKSGPAIKQKPSEVDRMKGVDLVTLSNNHMYDYGDEGLRDTLEALDAGGISSCGVLNKNSFYGEYIYPCDEGCVYFISVSEQEFNYSKTDEGIASLSVLSVYDAIGKIKAKDEASLIVVVVHGGVEFSKVPSPSLRETCRVIASFGASLVVCHHSHVVSAIESYNGVPIAYSLGNFLFEKKKAPQGWNVGLLLDVKVDFSCGVLEVYPLLVERNPESGVLAFLGETASVKALDELENLKLIVSNDELYYDAWLTESKSRFESYFSKLVSPVLFSGLGFAFEKLKLSKYFLFDKSLYYKLNLIRNQSHRDVIVSGLEREYEKRNK